MTPEQREKGQTAWMPEWTHDWGVHPGEVLAETLVNHDMTQADLAREWGVTQPYINRFIMGTRGTKITARVALRLERSFGVSARFWMHLQADWDLHQEREREATHA